jgi:tetratricopeptide (TPR) repeat protein
MLNSTFRRLVAASLASAALLAAPAFAQSRDQAIAWCLNKDHAFSADLVVRGCSSLLQVRGAPPNIEAMSHHQRGMALYELKNYDSALDDFNAAIRLTPDDAVLHNWRGLVYEAKGDSTRAIADYDAVLRVNPNDEWARPHRAALLRTTQAASAAPQAARDGSSMQSAIVIEASTENEGADAETRWMRRNFPGWKLGTQDLVDGQDGKKYDVIELTGPNGARKTIYFDISRFFGKS